MRRLDEAFVVFGVTFFAGFWSDVSFLFHENRLPRIGSGFKLIRKQSLALALVGRLESEDSVSGLVFFGSNKDRDFAEVLDFARAIEHEVGNAGRDRDQRQNNQKKLLNHEGSLPSLQRRRPMTARNGIEF